MSSYHFVEIKNKKFIDVLGKFHHILNKHKLYSGCGPIHARVPIQAHPQFS